MSFSCHDATWDFQGISGFPIHELTPPRAVLEFEDSASLFCFVLVCEMKDLKIQRYIPICLQEEFSYYEVNDPFIQNFISSLGSLLSTFQVSKE